MARLANSRGRDGLLLIFVWVGTTPIPLFGVGTRELCEFIAIDMETETPTFSVPSLLKNAFPWHDTFSTRDFARDTLGNITLKLTRDIELQSAYSSVPYATEMRMGDWMDASEMGDAPPYVFNWCRDSCAQQLSKLPMPAGLVRTEQDYFLSVGQQGKGIPLHQHKMTWMAQLAGTKTWLVAPPGQPPVEPYQHYTADAAAANNLQRCTQQQGEVVVLPEGWWHNTENHGWSLGIGGQPLAGTGGIDDEELGEGSNARLMMHVIHSNISALEDAVSRMSNSSKSGLFNASLSIGHVAVVDLLLGEAEPSNQFVDTALFRAASAGHQSLTQWLLTRKNSSDFFPEAEVHAAKHGHTDLLLSLLLERRLEEKRYEEEQRNFRLSMLGHLFTFDRQHFWENVGEISKELRHDLEQFERDHASSLPRDTHESRLSRSGYESLYYAREEAAHAWQYQYSNESEHGTLSTIRRLVKQAIDAQVVAFLQRTIVGYSPVNTVFAVSLFHKIDF